ncbi:MAG: sulfatase-like hydrolase/transferase [Nitrospiraceae bacterium]|nr:sulfatase-like hydrolase/transferase [Nitrospiraceae bacterium]
MNVIFVINDSLRSDHLGCYGNEWIKTPNIDAFAKKGALFTDAHSEGMPTLPYRTSCFTGRFTLPFRGWQRLEPTDVLLSEVLWNQGVTSAMITDVYHMHQPTMSYGRGFDTVKYIRGHEGDPHILDESIEVDVDSFYKGNGKDKKVRKVAEQYLRNRAHWKTGEDCMVAQVVKEGMKWLDEQPRRDNLFLWLDCFDPHEPWDPMPPFDEMYIDPDYKGQRISFPIPGYTEGYLDEDEIKCIRALYAGKVSQCDKWMGVFFDHLKELGLFDNSLVVFNSDHGEPFNEHGFIRKAFPTPYIEETQIPLIIRHPEGWGAGKRFDCLVNTPEIMPTILDFFGVKAPKHIHGESLLPILRGEKDKIRDFAISGQHGFCERIMTHEWALNCYLPRAKHEDELFDRVNDPAEQDNVIGQHPDVRDKLELQLRRFLRSLK